MLILRASLTISGLISVYRAILDVISSLIVSAIIICFQYIQRFESLGNIRHFRPDNIALARMPPRAPHQQTSQVEIGATAR